MTVHARHVDIGGELPDDLVTLQDIIDFGWCRRAALDRRVSRGVIPSYRVDGILYVSKSEARSILEGLEDGGIERVDPSVAAVDRVTKCISENISMLTTDQRRQLAGHLTGDFHMRIHPLDGEVHRDGQA